MDNSQLLIKVCGINRTKNMVDVSNLNIDMLGINYYWESKRYIDNTSININPNVKRVGVFVDPTLYELEQYTLQDELDYLQLHSDVTPDFCQQAQEIAPVIKAFGVDQEFDFATVMPYSSCEYFLFDTKTILHGGSGEQFDWSKLDEYEGEVPFLLAGGIGPDDVEKIKAIQHPKFAGVDINSRFEHEPGVKNVRLVEEFINQIKNN